MSIHKWSFLSPCIFYINTKAIPFATILFSGSCLKGSSGCSNVNDDEEFLRKVDQISGSIIIVDPRDSRDPTLALRLTNEGYHVEEISDAGTAAKVILKTGANVVISEINLPDTDGLRFCRALRKNPNTANITFFFHTAEEGERLAAECLGAGADDFLKKPADPELLSRKIKRTLAMKSPQESKKGVSGSLTEMSSSDIIQSLAAGDKDVEIKLECMGKGRIPDTPLFSVPPAHYLRWHDVSFDGRSTFS